MKKTYILTVMLLVLTVILSGCGSQDSDQASSGSFELSVEDTQIRRVLRPDRKRRRYRKPLSKFLFLPR